MSRDVYRGELHLVHGVSTVMRTDATLTLNPGILIAKSIAESSPRDMKELITAHKGEVALIIRAEVDCSIELMDELHIKVTIHGHELDQIKLLTDCDAPRPELQLPSRVSGFRHVICLVHRFHLCIMCIASCHHAIMSFLFLTQLNKLHGSSVHLNRGIFTMVITL